MRKHPSIHLLLVSTIALFLQLCTPIRARAQAKPLTKVVVGQSIREVCMLALFLEESARLQTEAMRLGSPMYMERDEAEKIAKRTFKPASVERAWEHFAAKGAG
jgi:hypothetical protein